MVKNLQNFLKNEANLLEMNKSHLEDDY